MAILMVSTWLKDFRSATTQMSATKCSMLSSTQAIFRGLQESLQESLRKLPDNVPSPLKQDIVKAHCKLSDYYTKFDVSPYYIWSSRKSPPKLVIIAINSETCQVLDPRISYEGLLADCSDDLTMQQHLENAKEELRQHYQESYEKTAASPPIVPLSASAEVHGSANSGSPQKVNFIGRYKRRPQTSRESSGSYLQKISRFAIQFDGGLGA